ncbi:transcriptional regulator, LacI family [Rathayibacter oskolensis]|uniref:Transcriptional regulator, LacI family n=1 Tax=Rathayibacter oskolensis TaxID=1891671 RepID=A0A1X7P150_9MICO|nr:LacI family DNA-binding transcriptional regulator [Rathayibacter oskolensis]SMH44350.1 transcriptional regulator, LacI family [Rathayibacter oskolensis]
MASRDRTAAVTLHDVARESGVSLATASRALNGSARKVNDEYRARVIAAATKLGYSPNLSAQAVAKGTTSTVALLVSDIADPYFSSIASGVLAAAEAAGLVVTIAVTHRDPVRELDLVRTLRGGRPRVMLLAGSRFDDEASRDALVAELESFERTGGRVVMLSQRSLPFPTVQLDNRAGARALAEELVALGYRRFAIVHGPTSLLTSSDRMQGFTDGLAAHGVTVDPAHVVETAFTRDGGHAATLRLLDEHGGDIDLVFAVNDVMAIGASSALRDRGIEPGRGIGVAGFDDIPTLRDVSPAITTVAVPLAELGSRAIAMALDDEADAESSVVLPTAVVVRESTPGLA